jgi:hypothetical protein
MQEAGFGELVANMNVRVKAVPADSLPCALGGSVHCPHEQGCCHCGYSRAPASRLN